MRVNVVSWVVVVGIAWSANAAAQETPEGAVDASEAWGTGDQDAEGEAGVEEAELPAADAEPTEGSAAASATQCFPACRSGYLCADGQCVEACNPPCSENQRCSAEGECIAETVDAPGDSLVEEDDWSSTSDRDEVRNWRRNSKGRMAGGIVMTSLGGLVLLNGVGFAAMGDTTTCYGGSCTGQDYTGLGAGLIVGGAVLVAIGIPLIISGAKRVPRHRYSTLTDVERLVAPRGAHLRF